MRLVSSDNLTMRVLLLSVVLAATPVVAQTAPTTEVDPTGVPRQLTPSTSPAPSTTASPATIPAEQPTPTHPPATPSPHRAKPAPASSATVSAPTGARLQTIVARTGFSPGLIDGKVGRKTATALEAFQRAKGLPPTGTADDATISELSTYGDPAKWTKTYKISASDVTWVTGPIPTDWNVRASMERSGYPDMEELLAERGWCSVGMVKTLNPGIDVNSLKAGDEVTLPDAEGKPLPKISRIEVDLGEKLVKGFDGSGNAVMLVHCSIARLMEKRPVGLLKVKVVATDPDYTFNPEDWPEVTNVTKKLRIPPGPRNPVGAAWVGLDKPGYGMHGTVKPQDIGKTGSHGCFRLANWDAVRLAKAVRIGTEVEVKE